MLPEREYARGVSRRVTYAVIALSAWLLGVAWALSSPVGSAPDDGFHLTTIWCATGAEEACRAVDGASGESLVEVPQELQSLACYAFKPEVSGACAVRPDGERVAVAAPEESLYPPTFHVVMSRFVGPDTSRSVVLMRVAAMTAGLVVLGLAAWSSPLLRDSQILAWTVTAVPLGLFVYPSTNPSSWAVAGVAALLPASYALLHATTAKAAGVAALAAVLGAFLASSRADTSGIAAALLVGMLILYARSRDQLRASLGLGVLVIALGAAVLGAGQSDALETGLAGADVASGIPLLWNNLLALPDIWVGVFGATFGLGWLDTAMPSLTWFPVILVTGGLVLAGVRTLGARKALMLAALAAALVVYPLLVLQRSGGVVGTLFQPRYAMPLVVLFVAAALAPLDRASLRLAPPQRWIATVAMTVAASAALHVQLRRYVTGTDVAGPDLTLDAEWPIGATWQPAAIWVLGTVAAAGLMVSAFRLLSDQPQGPGSDAGERVGEVSRQEPA